MDLKNTKDLVEQLLKKNPALRANDDVLYLEVCRKIKPLHIGSMTAEQFFIKRKELKLPSFESVRRSRAKIMEEHPELKPCEKVQKGREEQRERFYKMATKQGEFAF